MKSRIGSSYKTKITDAEVREIRQAGIDRDILRKKITAEYSNSALAVQFNTHVRNIERILNYSTRRSA